MSGKSFNELMEEKGYNGNQLKVKTDIPAMTINDLKNGKSHFENMKVKHAVKIAEAFKMTVEEIYNELS